MIYLARPSRRRPAAAFALGAFALGAFVALAAGLGAGPASAQNPALIAKARSGANCPGCNLFQADLSNLELKNRNFAGARLRQADMSAAVLTHSGSTAPTCAISTPMAASSPAPASPAPT
jgi:hypothetical protein